MRLYFINPFSFYHRFFTAQDVTPLQTLVVQGRAISGRGWQLFKNLENEKDKAWKIVHELGEFNGR